MEFQLAVLNCLDRSDRWIHVNQIKRARLPYEMRVVQINILKQALYGLFDPDVPFMENMPILEFFFESASRIGPERDELLAYCERVADELPYEEKQHLVDVLPHCEMRVNLLTELRRPCLENYVPINYNTFEDMMRNSPYAPNIPNVQYTVKKTIFTYHSDRQNVHNSTIARSVNKAMEQLEDLSREYSVIQSEFLKDNVLCDKQMKALRTISDDTSRMDLKNLFVHLWKRICESEHKADLVDRLKQELVEMAGQCKSGHASRLINVLSGYDMDFFTIKISYDDEIKAAFLARFERRIRESEDCDQYLLEMVSDEKSPSYVLFKENASFEVYDELLADYKPLFTETFTQERFDTIYSNVLNSV